MHANDRLKCIVIATSPTHYYHASILKLLYVIFSLHTLFSEALDNIKRISSGSRPWLTQMCPFLPLQAFCDYKIQHADVVCIWSWTSLCFERSHEWGDMSALQGQLHRQWLSRQNYQVKFTCKCLELLAIVSFLRAGYGTY